MARATFLMGEPESLEGISVRKLVLETDKYNVITAHTGPETIDLFHKFPKVDAIILHAELKGMSCENLIEQIRKESKEVSVYVLAPTDGYKCKGADKKVSSHDPQELLSMLRADFPNRVKAS